jgi:hypothetical protein
MIAIITVIIIFIIIMVGLLDVLDQLMLNECFECAVIIRAVLLPLHAVSRALHPA